MNNKLNINCPIYMINLDRSQDRLEFQKKQFKEYDLKFERIPAVDGRKLNQDNYKKLLEEIPLSHKWKEMSNGQKGCSLSHYFILNKMIKENIEYCLVLEDDSVFCDDFVNKFNEYFELEDLNNDIIYIGNQQSEEDLKKIEQYKKIRKPTFTTHAMIYTKKGAQNILNLINIKGLSVIDILYIESDGDGFLNTISYIKRPTEKEAQKNIHLVRSCGLAFQSLEFDSVIHS